MGEKIFAFVERNAVFDLEIEAKGLRPLSFVEFLTLRSLAGRNCLRFKV